MQQVRVKTILIKKCVVSFCQVNHLLADPGTVPLGQLDGLLAHVGALLSRIEFSEPAVGARREKDTIEHTVNAAAHAVAGATAWATLSRQETSRQSSAGPVEQVQRPASEEQGSAQLEQWRESQ